MENKELVVFYGMLFKKKSNKYYCNGAFGRYIDELSKKYLKLYLVVPVTDIKSQAEVNDYEIKSKNIVIQEIPEYYGYASALRKSILIKNSIKKHSEKWNSVVYIRWPVPFFKYVYNIASKKSLPVCFHLVGDSTAVVTEGDKYKGLKKLLAVKFAEYNANIVKKLIKNTPALVNGNGLRRLYDTTNENVKEIRTSTFSKNEILNCIPKIGNNSINLLYVGYLRHEKGLIYLLESIKLLHKKLDVKLTIVGQGDILEELKKSTIELGIEKYVNFKGHIPLGTTLFNEYKNNDIFVLPSISEGTPRVLLEAMCNGLVVVATNTGGIPFTVKNEYNGILVSSKNAKELSNAILRVVSDQNLRENLILNGFDFAEKNTLEAHIDEVYDFIKNMCIDKNVKIELKEQ